MIDAHQHFWTLGRGDYAWLTPDLVRLYRDFGPEDLAPLLAQAGIERTIVVQAAATIGESHHLLDLARKTPFIAGVVGWIDVDAASASDDLDDLAENPILRGLRPMIQDIPDLDWMLGEDLARVLRRLVAKKLSFDALVTPRHLPNLRTLLERHPDLAVVIDHAAKPDIAADGFEGWATNIAAIAKESGAFCKLSGLVTEAGEGWNTEKLRPFVDHLLECFGPDRLMWGSDWPVVTLAAEFGEWRSASLELLSGVGTSGFSAILGGTAERFYRLAQPEDSR